MPKSESVAYNEYQNAKDALDNAVKAMKEAAGDLDFNDEAIAEDIREILDENGINVEDWMI